MDLPSPIPFQFSIYIFIFNDISDATLCDKVFQRLATGRSISPDTPASFSQ
jgi:hypothetical protein